MLTHYLFHTLSILNSLNSVEKASIIILLLLVTVLMIDQLNKIVKANRSKKMLRKHLHLKENKWDNLSDLLTNATPLTPLEMQDELQIDLSKFDSRYKDILYHELIKIKKDKEVNPLNWQLIIDVLYNRTDNFK